MTGIFDRLTAAFSGNHRFATLTLILFHGYFALGLLVLGWAPDLVVFGYFIEAGVQLCFSAVLILIAREAGYIRTLAKFIFKALTGMALYFVFLIILDFVMKESYRADSLLLKLVLTLASFTDPEMKSEDFFVNLFTREMRNEFVFESAIAFFLTLLHQLALFFRQRKFGRLREPSLMALTQFWFLLAMVLFLVGYFKLALTFGWFLIITRVSFDWITHRGSASIQTKLARQFIYHLLVLVISVALLSDMKSLFERLMSAITAVVLLFGTSSLLISIKPEEEADADGVGKILPLWEKILLGGEILLILIIVFLPVALPANKKSIVELFPERRELLCSLGSGKRCVEIAGEILNSKKNWPAMEKAMADTEKFCEKNDAEACYILGTFYIDEIGGQKSAPGVILLEKACSLSHPFACLRLDKKAKARELWQLACEVSGGKPCFHLGRIHETQEKNLQKATEAYRKGCADGDAAACNAVGFFLEKDSVTGREATRHYLMACRSGNYTGCANAGYMYEKGKGVPINHSHAQSLLFLSCEQGKSGFGCYQYARFLQTYGSYDEITELSKWEAAQKFKQSCRLGYEAACRVR